jgi:hypothetical protein
LTQEEIATCISTASKHAIEFHMHLANPSPPPVQQGSAPNTVEQKQSLQMALAMLPE